MPNLTCDVAVVGAGSIGLAVAYYLQELNPALKVILLDEAEPMSLTSAASGENYRNWWPHPTMKQFMDRSFELIDVINSESAEPVIGSRSGYTLATRDPQLQVIENLHSTFTATDAIRVHRSAASMKAAGESATDGVDILDEPASIQSIYPSLDPAVNTLIEIRRGGQLSAHALGSHMLRVFRSRGGVLVKAAVREIEKSASFRLVADFSSLPGESRQKKHSNIKNSNIIEAVSVVNAAGPLALQLASLLGVDLPIYNVLQQKISFVDHCNAIDRRMPFMIDLDKQFIDWHDDDRKLIAADAELSFLGGEMPGCIHCRPDGGVNGKRIKLGWAYNEKKAMAASESLRQPSLDDHFPEIVIRGASRLHPALKNYIEEIPHDCHHYGGHYTMTEENWPLIGATPVPGFFVATAMSGFGTMAACAAGELTARWVTGSDVPDYAVDLSLQRYADQALMDELAAQQSRGLL